MAAIAAVVVLYLIVAFNRLVRQRNVVREGWSGIDVHLERRTDLFRSLVETVKGYVYGIRCSRRSRRGGLRSVAAPAMSAARPMRSARCRARSAS